MTLGHQATRGNQTSRDQPVTVFNWEVCVTAPGLLADFNAAGVLAPADVHTAVRLGELWGEEDDSVRLAIALTVRALRGGSVCVDVTSLADMVLASLEEPPGVLPWPEATAWAAAIRKSPAVAIGTDSTGGISRVDASRGDGGRPLRLVGNLFYLERYWAQEDAVREHLNRRGTALMPAGSPESTRLSLDALFPGSDLPAGTPNHQRLAGAMAALTPVTVVAGGPGTGKTRTVARILALLGSLADVHPQVALAAPTGKAAARLDEEVRRAADELGDPWRAAIGTPPASTLHRLLGWRPNGTHVRHHRDNPLPHDLVVVDEMSMVSLTQMYRLLEALRPQARLVLVGDPDQLASVEAGAVLADITRGSVAAPEELLAQLAYLTEGDRPAGTPTGRGVVTLQHTWRFAGSIATLAQAIRDGDGDAAVDVVLAQTPDVRFIETEDPLGSPALGEVRERTIEVGRQMWTAAHAGDVTGALAALDSHRVLCAHRRGPWGVGRWSHRIVEWLQAAIPDYGAGLPRHPRDRTRGEDPEWYAGLPLLVNSNDPDAGLFNGDTGILVNTASGLRAAFLTGDTPRLLSTIQLASVSPLHAMTVHKSQGSQFGEVVLVLPPEDSPLLTRELLYTAITRAVDKVTVIGTREAIRRAVQRPANRASGLAVQQS